MGPRGMSERLGLYLILPGNPVSNQDPCAGPETLIFWAYFTYCEFSF